MRFPSCVSGHQGEMSRDQGFRRLLPRAPLPSRGPPEAGRARPVTIGAVAAALTAAALGTAATTGVIGGTDDDGGGGDSADSAMSEGSELVESVEVTRDPDHPLRGSLRVRTTAPAAVTVEVRTPDGHGFSVSPPRAASRDRTVPLLGLRADEEYAVSVELLAEGSDEAETVEAGTVRTGSLPGELPPLEVAAAGGSEATLTLFDVAYRAPDGEEEARDHGYLVVVDEEGEVVWFHGEEQSIQDARRTADGTFLFTTNETGAREVSPTGELVDEWVGRSGAEVAPEDDFGRPVAGGDAVRVATDQMHHEIGELPNGNLVTLSREVRSVEYPESLCDDEEFDGSEDVGGDVVVEFDPDTGEVVREISLFDVIDPLDNLERTRASEFCSTYLEDVYPESWPVRDWTHANAVVLDEGRNALIVSARHTDSLLAIRDADDEDGPAGELLWELGEGGDFELEGEGEWFLHQHAPQVLADGSILLYDNGNERPGTSLEGGGEAPYTRAVRYRLDEEASTAEQVWEHRAPPGEEPVYAPYVGDADLTPQGTVLLAHGGLLEPPAHSPAKPDVVQWARILEVDETTGEPILDVRVGDPEGDAGWRAYRAERIPTLYPAGYVVEPLA